MRGLAAKVLKILLIYGSDGPFVWRSGTICALLVEGIIRKNSVVSPLFAKRNYLCNLGKGRYEECFSEII